MYTKILELATATVTEIKKDQNILTSDVEKESTTKLANSLKADPANPDSDKIISVFKHQRNKVANSFRLGVFAQKNSAFVKKCDLFIKVAHMEQNQFQSLVYQLPEEILVYIFSFLDQVEIEWVKQTNSKFNALSKLNKTYPFPQFDLSHTVASFDCSPDGMIERSVIFVDDKEIVYPKIENKITFVKVNAPTEHRSFHLRENHGDILAVDRGKKLLFCGGFTNINVWSLAWKECIAQLATEHHPITCMDYTDGRLLAGNTAHDIIVWYYPGEHKFIRKAHQFNIHSILNYPDKQYFLSFSRNKTKFDLDQQESDLKLWNSSLECVAEFNHADAISHVCLHPGLKMIVAAQKDSLMLLNMNTLEVFLVVAYPEKNFKVLNIKYHPSGKIALVRNDKTLGFYNPLTMAAEGGLHTFSSHLYEPAVTINERTGAVALVSNGIFAYRQFPTVHRTMHQTIIKKLDKICAKISELLVWNYGGREGFWVLVCNEAHLLKLRELFSKLGLANNCNNTTKLNAFMFNVRLDDTLSLRHLNKLLDEELIPTNTNVEPNQTLSCG